MTTTAPSASDLFSWDEPAGIAPRGTLVVLTGRGETPVAYARLGRRLASDAYKVLVVEVDLDDLEGTEKRIETLLTDAGLPAPRVLVGSDSGATLAALLLDRLPADAAVLAGLALPSSARVDGDWDAELEARTACPTHRRVISEDAGFARGGLARELPWSDLHLEAPAKPVLVVHGSADPVTSADQAFAAYVGAPAAELYLVDGAHHDVLNDVTHRSVAATLVLFLERLKLGADRPAIITRTQ